MIFVVEDGTGKADATSLTSVERASEYLAATGYASDWAGYTEDRKEELLMSATTVASNSFSFRGCIEFETQALPFPRKDLKDREGRTIQGVPALAQNAIAELAYSLSQNNYIQDSDLSAIENIRVGPIALEVSESAAETKVVPDSVIRLLSEYGAYRFGRNRMRRLVAG